MTEPLNRFSIAVQDDPPVLRALLLAAGADIGAREQIRQAYHGHLEGARSSPFVLHGILLSAIYASIRASIDERAVPAATAAEKLNSNQPADLKMSQLSDLIKRTDALALCIKSLPRREDAVSRHDMEKLLNAAGNANQNPELTAFLDDWRITKSQENTANRTVTRWLGRVAAIALITSIVFVAGYLVCWINLRKDFDARVDRVIDAQQSAYRVPLFLAAHRGSIALASLKPAEGHNESQGIIIWPGDLKFAESWVSTDGATVVPLR
jgi:hypothetical protein